jgi:hypothetical protein
MRSVNATKFHRKSGGAKPRDLQFRGPLLENGPPPQNELSSRPERTQISYISTLTTARYAAFLKESRMNFFGATNLDRKSGVAEWRDLRFLSRSSLALRNEARDFAKPVKLNERQCTPSAHL